MKKKNIILSIVFFVVSQALYLYLLKTQMDYPIEMKRLVYTPLFCLTSMIWFSFNLWDNTTNEFLKTISKKPIRIVMSLFYLIIIIFVGNKFYIDFGNSTLFHKNKILFFTIGFFDALSIVIFMTVAYRGIFLSIYKLKDE
jgi:membrane protein CcdC involved in cytochrome C biogenesis